MESKMSTAQTRRAASAPIEVSISLDSVKKALPMIAPALALILSFLALVGFRMEAMRLSTMLSGLNTAHQNLGEEVNKLKTELGYRIRPDQLEARAAMMGLVRPEMEEKIILDE
ncbi:hypothetical protein EPN96_07365 [bacterium]|nr:MAG: hypothetical protein EPN96_07365 [bacterium]